MDQRSYESPMEWEYQNARPVDPTSPFAAAVAKAGAQNVFKPSAGSQRPNPFMTPSKQPRSAASLFSPQPHPLKQMASPFRNPAFTTPQKPFNEPILSEASGAEDSPCMTETSDFPNDTPEVDRSADITMGGTIVPSKIDKSLRYLKSSSASRRHVPGRGEIKAHRDPTSTDLRRRRKRHNHDKEVSSIIQHGSHRWHGEDSDSDDSAASYSYGRGRRLRFDKKHATDARQPGTFLDSFFNILQKYPDAPNNFRKWITALLNTFVVSIVIYWGWALAAAVRSDVQNTNERARTERLLEIKSCREEYHANGCETNIAPRLQEYCAKMNECMTQNPESIMRISAVIKHVFELINESIETMSTKTLVFFIAVIFAVAIANNGLGWSSRAPSHLPASRTTSEPMPMNPMASEATPGYMWIPVQTPKRQRHAMLTEDTDTDNSPPKMLQMAVPYTPSRQKSPSKGERSRSPIKQLRSPLKGM